MKYLFILISLLFTRHSFAQDSIVVHKDSRLDILTSKQAVINRKSAVMSRNTKIDGFRVLVISTRNREEAFTVKAQLMQNFPTHKSYTLFQSPNFRVKIGNFTNREDAEILKKALSKMYSQNMYVVKDMVEYIPTEEELFQMQE